MGIFSPKTKPNPDGDAQDTRQRIKKDVTTYIYYIQYIYIYCTIYNIQTRQVPMKIIENC